MDGFGSAGTWLFRGKGTSGGESFVARCCARRNILNEVLLIQVSPNFSENFVAFTWEQFLDLVEYSKGYRNGGLTRECFENLD
ncbi:hypothetical protein EYC80_004078 [Monilinia laxa]|uniref:Uncharacterized protein n=1 Tax=Monilinia laxa TaxID=61186 RepID=A0A5N6KNN7_MONLA|nr:hypothetical protein EYC80_004078 [Monilinia laxa]